MFSQLLKKCYLLSYIMNNNICVLEKVFHLMFLFEYKIEKEKEKCPKPFFPVKSSKYIQANQIVDA